MDDFVVLCETQEEAQHALERIKDWVQTHELALNPEKTHVGNCQEPGHGFEFLGYRFEAGQRLIRRKSQQAFRDKVKALTRRSCGQSLNDLTARLNPMLKGWFAYFKHAQVEIFSTLDAFIRRRLRSILCKQNKLGYYYNSSKAIHQRWPAQPNNWILSTFRQRESLWVERLNSNPHSGATSALQVETTRWPKAMSPRA